MVRLFVFVWAVMAWTGLVDHKGGVKVGPEVPGVDVGVTAEGGVHDMWLGVGLE